MSIWRPSYSAPIACQLCKAGDGVFRCDWVMKDAPVRTRIDQIRKGDVVRTADKKFVVAVTAVEITSRSPVLYGKLIGTVLKTGKAGGHRLADLVWRLGQSFIVLKPAPCGALICERCVRELDDNRHYCKSHWNAWREVA